MLNFNCIILPQLTGWLPVRIKQKFKAFRNAQVLTGERGSMLPSGLLQGIGRKLESLRNAGRSLGQHHTQVSYQG